VAEKLDDSAAPKVYRGRDALRGTVLGSYLSRQDSGLIAEFALPWPERDLSPNAAVHYRTRAAAILRNKLACRLQIQEQIAGDKSLAGRVLDLRSAKGPLWLGILLVCPDRRKRDLDNLVARLKSSLDALADCLGVNDNRFAVLCARMARATAPGGIVRVAVSLAQPDDTEDPVV
jgi:crossover junction endodeoxyribonuclease RusA